MASLNEIAYAYAESVGKSDDIALVRRIKFTIKYYRALFARQDFERNGQSKDMLQRYIDELIKVDELDSVCIQVGCSLLRTKNTVPKPVRSKGNLFYRVGPIRLTSAAWKESDLAEVKYQKFAKFTKNATLWYYINDYIYVIAEGKFKWISVTGVGVDPNEWNDKCLTNPANCVSDDDEFPMPADYLARIYAGMRSSELALQIPEKEINVDGDPR